MGVSWIAAAEMNGFAPSEDSRKTHKFGVGVDSPSLTSCAQGKFGQEARVTSV